jgi:tRNA pseudouridine38-40 synthase
MQEASRSLLGQHDFSAFRAAGCQASTAVREVKNLDIIRSGDWLILTVTANAFLQHMVRNIAGTLVAIGNGERPVHWMEEVLQSRDRGAAGIAAPPHGLTLLGVDYPPRFNLPQWSERTPLILQ